MGNLKKKILEINILRKAWARYRSNQAHERYRGWMEKYSKLAGEMNLMYTETAAKKSVRAYMEGRNIKPKAIGEIHSAIFTLTHNWGIGVISELKELGSVVAFDYQKEGYSANDPKLPLRLPELNNLMMQFLRNNHKQKPIDWILFTHSGGIILRDTIRRIREELGIPIVNQWLDCKQSFEGGVGLYGQDTGQKDIAPEFDLVWTTSRSVCEWYMVVGARPIFLPEGFSPYFTPRINCKKTGDVGFLGQCYGLRTDYLNALKNAGLSVLTGGYDLKGYPVIPVEKMGDFIGSCKVNLGMGGIGYSMDLTTLKGRDFEIPGAGGTYLTTYNPDLALFFDIGKEIFCYHSINEMVELASRLVRDEALCQYLAENAYKRSMREHRWMHRFRTILGILGIVNDSTL